MGILLVEGGSPWWPWSGYLVDLDLRPLLAPHLPIYHPSRHRDNVTAPHGRPNLRSRLHFPHSQEGGPRNFVWTCGGIRKKNNCTVCVITWKHIPCSLHITSLGPYVELTIWELSRLPLVVHCYVALYVNCLDTIRVIIILLLISRVDLTN